MWSLVSFVVPRMCSLRMWMARLWSLRWLLGGEWCWGQWLLGSWLAAVAAVWGRLVVQARWRGWSRRCWQELLRSSGRWAM